MLPNQPKGDPQVVSNTEGQDITPDNPEVVKQVPVPPNDQEAIDQVEGTVDAEPTAEEDDAATADDSDEDDADDAKPKKAKKAKREKKEFPEAAVGNLPDHKSNDVKAAEGLIDYEDKYKL